MNELDDVKHEVVCDCGQTVTATLGEIRTAAALHCPSGHTIEIDAGDLDLAMQAVDESFDQMPRF